MRVFTRCYIYFSFFCSLWKCKDHCQSKMTQKQATVQTGPSVRKLLLDDHSQHHLLNEYTQKCTPSSPSSLALPPFSFFIVSLSISVMSAFLHLLFLPIYPSLPFLLFPHVLPSPSFPFSFPVSFSYICTAFSCLVCWSRDGKSNRGRALAFKKPLGFELIRM